MFDSSADSGNDDDYSYEFVEEEDVNIDDIREAAFSSSHLLRSEIQDSNVPLGDLRIETEEASSFFPGFIVVIFSSSVVIFAVVYIFTGQMIDSTYDSLLSSTNDKSKLLEDGLGLDTSMSDGVPKSVPVQPIIVDESFVAKRFKMVCNVVPSKTTYDDLIKDM